MPPLLDTNIIIRHVTADEPRLAERARSFLKLAEAGIEQVLLTEGVLVEAVQVLSSRVLYNLPRAEIARDLAIIIELQGVRLAGKNRYLRALDLFVSEPRLDFVDALLVAYAEQQASPEIVSYDRDFDRVLSVTRREPAAVDANSS